MKIETLREQPFLTGLLLGLVVWLVGNGSAAGAGTVALLFFGTGVVLAVFGERWIRSGGQTLAAAGATTLLAPIAVDVVIGLLDFVAPSVF